jgi:phage/plasmid-associated DNA primase
MNETPYNDRGDYSNLGRVVPVLCQDENGETYERDITCDFGLTDMGNADRLVSDYGDDIRFCATTNTWYIWNGKHWEPDLKAKIVEIAKKRIRFIYTEAQSAINRDTEKKLKDWAYSSQSGPKLREMIRLTQSDARISILPGELDANPYLLSCESGTIDFLNCPRDRPYREYRREDLITQYTPRRYDPEADGSKWYETLLGALPPRVIFFLQDAFGYSAIHTLDTKAFFYIYGIPDGRKSSVLDAAFAALGDYVTAFDYKTFGKSYDGPQGPRVDIIDLENKRGAQCSELPKDFIINDALIKSTTSANPKHVRGMFEKRGHDAVIKAKLWFESNFMARINFEDDANFNRLNVIVFNRELPQGVFKDDKMRTFLQTDEATQDAIFTWIIDGAYEFMERGLNRPPEIDAASKEYQRMMNPLNWFLNEYLIKDEGGEVKATTLYERFKVVAEAVLNREGRDAVKNELRSVKSFGKTFKMLVDHKDKTDGLYYLGITLPPVWSDETGGDGEDTYMRSVVKDGDNGDNEDDFVKSLSNSLAYVTFRNTYDNHHYHHPSKESPSEAKPSAIRTDQATQAKQVKELLEAWQSAHKSLVGRADLIDATAMQLLLKNPSFNTDDGEGPEYLKSFIERLSTEDREIQGLLANLTR